MVQFATYSSPFGPVQIGHRDGRIVSIRCGSFASPHVPSEVSELANHQLQEYFAGKRTAFDLPLELEGTSFQLAVWNSMREIPYGETRTYGQLAAAIGRPAASRAVGQAANRNPIWIVIPCHRIVGSNHSLTGYAGGLDLKQKLLDLEKTNT